MARHRIFYSFHFDKDVMRVQQVRNIGSLEDNPPVSVNEWEQVRRTGDAGIKRWIDETMRHRACMVVLVGADTAARPWVKYEIRKAWNDGKGLFGIHIHNLNCPRNGRCAKGTNPFDQFKLDSGVSLSSIVPCYDPSSVDTYKEIAANIEAWVELAIARRT